MKVPVVGCLCNLLILTAAHLCSQTVLAATLSLQQRLDITSKYKRSVEMRSLHNDNAIYSRNSLEIAESVYSKLYRDILLGKPKVDVMLIIDSSSNMGLSAFLTARKFLAKLVSMMPIEKFRDGSIKVAMMNCAVSGDFISQFDFSWANGQYRELVRRAVKRAEYQDGIENHGTIAMVWADKFFENSTRYNEPETAKVILYATNGYITDGDVYGLDSTRRVATALKRFNYTMFTIVPGTDVNRATVRTLSSEPTTDHVIPVVNNHALESIASHIKEHKRGAHHHNAS